MIHKSQGHSRLDRRYGAVELGFVRLPFRRRCGKVDSQQENLGISRNEMSILFFVFRLHVLRFSNNSF